MSIEDRLVDAELLRRSGRDEGALLSMLVAVAALARQQHPDLGDRACFEALLRSYHDWTVEVKYRGRLIGTDHLLYKWLRCHRVHEAALPPDIRIDHDFADPASLTVCAGGPPEHAVLLSPGWLQHLSDQTRQRIHGEGAVDEPVS